MPPAPLARLRRLALALPEAHEVEAWGEPTFRVRDKLFAMYAGANNHHGAGRPGVWLKAAPGNQAFMIAAAPDRFFVPPYVGPSGWIGVFLDGAADWAELAELLRDAWRLTAPKRVVAAAEAGSGAIAKPAARKQPAKRSAKQPAKQPAARPAGRASKPATSAPVRKSAKRAAKAPARRKRG